MNSECRIPGPELDGLSRFERYGFQIFQSLIESDKCDLLSTELTPLFEQQQKSAKSRIGGVRNLLRSNVRVGEFARSPGLTPLLQEFANSSVFPVRAILFDKTPEANWLVPWHQDLTIAIEERIETPGFTDWSVKDGVLHVHPPHEVLESMITMRLHLDDCGADNGALKVIPGSHLHGKLNVIQITDWTCKQMAVTCVAPKGGGLLMRPLLLHSSSSAQNPLHRRVLHIEYATQKLPNGLKWSGS